MGTRAANADFGTGLYGSDHLASENGQLRLRTSQVPGMIHQFEETTEAKLVSDLDQLLDQAGAKSWPPRWEKYSPAGLLGDLQVRATSRPARPTSRGVARRRRTDLEQGASGQRLADGLSCG